ncbi:MAG TPA: NAD(P)H-dependent oxidoreductase subunit E [Opitutaceae bacterium]|nr:NAD(P)H-dependent oxidoreductase subunit E [Opitutaceae bacterium]
MNPSEPTPGAEAAPASENWRNDEGALLAMLEEIERRHGYIPQQIGDEVSRLLEVRLERLKRAQAKLESGVRRDVQQHVARWRGEEGNLIMILHEIQNQYGYVPREVAMELARELGVKLARIYEVITFYHYFKLQPPGRHNVTICNGTACYLKGAAGLLAELRAQLGVGEGQTTPDREFHVDVVRCIGCCGMSPAVVCDGRTHGRVKPTEIAGILDEARHRAKKEAAV